VCDIFSLVSEVAYAPGEQVYKPFRDHPTHILLCVCVCVCVVLRLLSPDDPHLFY
jgi:hypothetical protein